MASMHTPSITERRRAFHALRHSGCFALPNPWGFFAAEACRRQG
jgi:hypothetical protein